MSPSLINVLFNADENVLVLPDLLMGELLLFLKVKFIYLSISVFGNASLSLILKIPTYHLLWIVGQFRALLDNFLIWWPRIA